MKVVGILFAVAVVASLDAMTGRPVDWETLNCPSQRFDNSCDYHNTYPDDMAVTLFFQHEDYHNNADFECRGSGVTYCQRSWDVSEAGSAGSCYFILPAGESYSCDGHNNVKVIDVRAVRLNGTVLEAKSQWKTMSCPGVNGDCSYDNKGGDLWVQAAYTAKEGASLSLGCTIDGDTVCSYVNVNTSFADRSSCSFIVPQGKTLKCSGKGNLDRADVYAKTFTSTLFPSTPVTNVSACPSKTYPKPTMCDCSFQNPYDDRDVVITMVTESVDNNFNSFHCAVWGANVCSWGTARGNMGDGGGCYFVLPAGASYTCEMQWGATSFVQTSAQPLSTSIYKPNDDVKSASTRRVAEPQKSARTTSALRQMFAAWKARHGKQYASKIEENTRFENFVKFVGLADAMNEKLSEVSTINHLADMSVNEFEASYKGCGRVDKTIQPNWDFSLEDMADLPASVDWRQKGAVTPVKDQAQCGSCWSFSTTGALEGAWFLAGNNLTGLSEQNLVACEKDCGGCGGGWPFRAMDWVAKNGIDTEASYPYTSGQGQAGSCETHQTAKIEVTGHVAIPHDENAMMTYLAKYGPVSISLDAMTQLWWPYAGGIMKTCCNSDIDHAVLLVGYGEEKGTKFWLIKNSWGESWGENGYIRLERGTNQCGITAQPVSPTVAGGSLPPPPPPPGPEGRCPDDATVFNSTDGYHHCRWINGTKNVTMPPTPQDYCMYIVKDNSFGYVWDKDTAAGFDVYPCPPSARASETKESYFCTIQNGDKGAYFPVDVEPDCANITHGVFGWKWQ